MRLRTFSVWLLGLALGLQTWAAPVPKITLDFDNTEVTVVLSQIARLWGRSIHVDPWVRGKVTIHVQELEADEAIRRVLAQLSIPAVFSERTMTVSMQAKGTDQTRKTISQGTSISGAALTQSGPFEIIGSIPSGIGSFQGGRFASVNDNTESYKGISENAFHKTSQDPLSTFSTDVDTGSYSNVRRMLKSGKKPPADAVRIEEMLNYFSYNYELPSKGNPIGITTHLGLCPWAANHRLLQVGLRTAPHPVGEAPKPRNLVFLVDVSGSMESPDKLPLAKQSLDCLVQQLSERDHIAMVVYAGSSGMPLGTTSGEKKVEIRQAIQQLNAGGSTNGEGGIRLAYQVAKENFNKNGINRVILCTDGDFNVGVSSERELVKLIEQERQSGVFLSVLAFGTGNLKDDKMEQLADKGNGNYAYIDSLMEARKVLVNQAGATLATVAKDVKIQVEFNPAVVAGYRLVGYENRILNAQDFNNDKKDAGEMGEDQTVTALYEIVPPGQQVPDASTDPLRYQTVTPGEASESGEVALVKIRYKAPDSEVSSLLEQAIVNSGNLEEPKGELAFASAVAAFGMLLRDSPWKGSASYLEVRRWAAGALGADQEGYRSQFLDLVDKAHQMSLAREPGT